MLHLSNLGFVTCNAESGQAAFEWKGLTILIDHDLVGQHDLEFTCSLEVGTVCVKITKFQYTWYTHHFVRWVKFHEIHWNTMKYIDITCQLPCFDIQLETSWDTHGKTSVSCWNFIMILIDSKLCYNQPMGLVHQTDYEWLFHTTYYLVAQFHDLTT